MTTVGRSGERPHPMLRPDSRLTPELIAEYTQDAWDETSLRALVRASAEAHPQRAAVVTDAAGDGRRVTSYLELEAMIDSVSGGLLANGIEPGDVVAILLPNGLEATVAIFAINAIGAAFTGIPASYGPREIEAILRGSDARAVIVAERHGRHELLTIVRSLQGQLANLRTVVVARDDGAPPAALDPERGEVGLDEMLRSAPRAVRRDDARMLAHIGYTSGTTGTPKGVMNTSQTLLFVIRRWVEHVGPSQLSSEVGHPVNLVASPVGHHTGFVWGVVLSALLGGTAVHLPRWNAEHAARIIEQEAVSVLFGAPTFLLDLASAKALPDAPDCPLRMAVVAGAPVPRDMPAAAAARLGAYICPAWGMTEYALGASCSPLLPPDVLRTDGAPVAGCELRIVGPDDVPVVFDQLGALQIRGAGLFAGYFRQPEHNTSAFTADGWFRTGDTARLTGPGYVELSGREKDIVIRGGENIPVVEVESVLYAHPAVAELALVGVPHSRLGEQLLAVVVPRSVGRDLTLTDITDHLAAAGVARHYWPERLVLVDGLPKTASGKIRKIELRSRYT